MQDLVGFFHACRNHYSDEKNLTRFYSQVYSQNGEDGMIAEVFRRIGTTDRFFVEIGVENGLQCNTRFLLETGWTGVWIEGDRTRAAEVSKLFAPFITANRLKILHAFVSAESVESLLEEALVPQKFDFLSLDVDQNTSHIWKAIRRFEPRVSCIEYNASIPPSCAIEVPYAPNRPLGRNQLVWRRPQGD